MIDRKFEPLVKRLMVKYLGELEDDDLVMFVLEHLKDHKGPQKLIEGLEPVRLLNSIRALNKERYRTYLVTGTGGRSYRAHHQCLATSDLRKYGLRRRSPYGAHDGRLTNDEGPSCAFILAAWYVRVVSIVSLTKLYKILLRYACLYLYPAVLICTFTPARGAWYVGAEAMTATRFCCCE